MPTTARDQSTDALILAGTVIDLGGDSESAVVTFEAPNSVTRSISKRTIANKMQNPGATLTVTLYPEDPGYRQIRRLIAARKALPVDIPEPGSLAKTGNLETVMWADAILVSIADFASAQETAVVTFVYELVDFRVVTL